jgi:A/G-specific adenine glycosylase
MKFTEDLLTWYHTNKRNLPWRETTDAYNIWLSEIILQQTRINQGWDYYIRFISKFPNVKSLAEADEDIVLKLWEGLGYYSRARNLHFSAKFIQNDLSGIFPSTYNEILKLKGVGVYTASAIASICFGEYEPVVDGNVYRFLSRIFNIDTPINTPDALKEFRAIAQTYINKADSPGCFNQALMEYGALVCKPVNPECNTCIFKKNCQSYKLENINKRPVKLKKIKVTERYLYFFIPNEQDYIYIEKRTNPKDIWRNLYQLPLIETEKQLSKKELSSNYNIVKPKLLSKIVHKLTHQNLHISFYEVENEHFKNQKELINVSQKRLVDFAFPKPIKTFLFEFYNI